MPRLKKNHSLDEDLLAVMLIMTYLKKPATFRARLSASLNRLVKQAGTADIANAVRRELAIE